MRLCCGVEPDESYLGDFDDEVWLRDDVPSAQWLAGRAVLEEYTFPRVHQLMHPLATRFLPPSQALRLRRCMRPKLHRTVESPSVFLSFLFCMFRFCDIGTGLLRHGARAQMCKAQ